MARNGIKDRARELFGENPSWGKRRVAYALKQEYGKALRWETLLDIKRQVAYATPSRAGEFYRTGGVSRQRLSIYRGWRSAGFTSFESHELIYGHGRRPISLEGARRIFQSVPGRLARRSRGRWLRGLINRGWSKSGILVEIKKYYRSGGRRSPWDFIRLEYKPQKKVDFRDYRHMARLRAEKRIARLRGARG